MKNRIYSLLTLIMLSFVALISSCSEMTTQSAPVSLQANPKHLALLLPLSGPYAGAGQAVRDGFLTAYYNTTPSATSPTVVRVYDTANGKTMTQVYQQAVADKADIIVGPLQKDEVTQLANVGPSLPVLALNYPLNLNRLPSGFYEFGLSPQNEAVQVAQRAASDGHHNMLVIYPSDAWGDGVAAAFGKQWQAQGGSVVGSLGYTPTQNFQTAIQQLLRANPCSGSQANCTAQRRQDFDAIFIIATPQVARQIIPMLQYYYAGNVAMYSTSLIYGGTPNPNYYRDMGSVIFCDMPWVISNNTQLQPAQNQIAKNWPAPYQNYVRLYALGIDAFALTSQLDTLANGSSSYSGATGTLSINRRQQVMRQLQWAQFQNGQVTAIN